MNNQQGPLEEIAGDWFVNRHRELDLFWQWATSIPERTKGSYALIGLRRTGKTAILHRLFNRLFHEQTKVIPVYISFARYLKRAEPITAYEFAEEYFLGLVRSVLAFRYRLVELLRDRAEYQQLLTVATTHNDELVLEWFRLYEGAKAYKDDRVRAHSLMQWVINFPKGYAWGKNVPMAFIIDEFQVLTRVYNPDSSMLRKLTDSFQEASETRWAPLLVSGSSVSMMAGEALGGMLSGRFSPWTIGPLSQAYAVDMVFHLGKETGITVTEELALAIWKLTQGFPYSIERLLKSTSPDAQLLPSLDALPKVLLYELTEEQGALRKHYREEYGKYIHEFNGDQTIRKVLLWLIKYPERTIFADELAAELRLEERKVQETLEKLDEADIIKSTGWYSYEGPADPLLRRYIEYNHAREVEKLAPEVAAQSLLAAYQKLRGETNRQVGHLAEIIVGGVMHSFDGRTVAGAPYFNGAGAVTLPKFARLERRGGVVKDGLPTEIDLIGEWRTPMTPTAAAQVGVWLVSVRHRNQAMGEGEVRAFLEQTTRWLTEKQVEKPFDQVTRWYVSKQGFTKSARELLLAEGVYASDLAQFNQLAQLFGFLPLTD